MHSEAGKHTATSLYTVASGYVCKCTLGHWVCWESWAHNRLFNLPPQFSRLGTQPRSSSQGWAPSPAPVLKAGHPAPPQLSRLGTQPRPSSQGWAPSPTPVLKAGHPGSCFLVFPFCMLCLLCFYVIFMCSFFLLFLTFL